MKGTFPMEKNSYWTYQAILEVHLWGIGIILDGTFQRKPTIYFSLRPNSPAPLTDNWKVTDDLSVNFHDVFFFIFCQIIAKNEEKHVMEIYG